MLSLYFYIQSFVWLVKDFMHTVLLFQVSNKKLSTVVEGNPKAPFSLATTLRFRRGRYSFPWIALLCP